MNAVNDVQAEVQRLADEMTPELLPMLLERLSNRAGVVLCERHLRHLIPYIGAQIALTRTKRAYFGDYAGNPFVLADNFQLAVKRRNELRATYRSIPCTCWVPKR